MMAVSPKRLGSIRCMNQKSYAASITRICGDYVSACNVIAAFIPSAKWHFVSATA